MFILRQIDLEGVNMNFALGKDYAVINRENHPTAYQRVSEIMFRNKNYPRHEPVGIVSAEFGDFFLNQNEHHYIMLESGKTFEKLPSSFTGFCFPEVRDEVTLSKVEVLANMFNETETYFNDRFSSVKQFKEDLIKNNCLAVYLDGVFKEGEYDYTDFFVFEGAFWKSVRPTEYMNQYKCKADIVKFKKHNFVLLGEQEEVDFEDLNANEHFDYLKYKTHYFYRKGSELFTNIPHKSFKMKPCKEGMFVQGIIIDCDDLLEYGDPFAYSKAEK